MIVKGLSEVAGGPLGLPADLGHRIEILKKADSAKNHNHHAMFLANVLTRGIFQAPRPPERPSF
jgi:hypothetical protein